MSGRLILCAAAAFATAGRGAGDEIAAEVVPGVTGHPSYMTHSYSQPLVVHGDDVYLAFLEDDVRTSSSIIRRDGRTGDWSSPFRLGGGRRYDGHYYPNLVMDPNGLFHVFYGCHGDAMRYRRSSRPRVIEAWEPESYPLSVATYPRPFVLASGEIVVFSRTQKDRDTRYGYIRSQDGGKSWSAFKTIIHGPGRLWTPYVGGVSIVEADRTSTIHLCWSWYDMSKRAKPFYYEDAMYATHVLGSDEWSDGRGSIEQLPITYTSATPIRRGEKLLAEDMAIDSRHRPLVLISQYGLTEEEKRDSKTLLGVFERNTWHFSELLPGTVFPAGGVRMIHVADWTMIAGYASAHGLIIAQRRDGTREFLIRPVQRMKGLTPVHPVIVADDKQLTFHVVATGYERGQPGRLIYASARIEP